MNQHIFIEENEIRIADDSGGPSLHVIRPKTLDKDYYNSFPLTAIQQQTQGVTNSSVLVDSQLSVPADAYALYKIEGFIEWDASGTVAQQLNISAPSGSTGKWSAVELIANAASAYVVGPTAVNVPVDGLTGLTTDGSTWHINGWVRCGGTNGNIVAQFARDSSGVANQTVQIVNGSWLSIQRMA